MIFLKDCFVLIWRYVFFKCRFSFWKLGVLNTHSLIYVYVTNILRTRGISMKQFWCHINWKRVDWTKLYEGQITVYFYFGRVVLIWVAFVSGHSFGIYSCYFLIVISCRNIAFGEYMLTLLKPQKEWMLRTASGSLTNTLRGAVLYKLQLRSPRYIGAQATSRKEIMCPNNNVGACEHLLAGEFCYTSLHQISIEIIL